MRFQKRRTHRHDFVTTTCNSHGRPVWVAGVTRWRPLSFVRESEADFFSSQV